MNAMNTLKQSKWIRCWPLVLLLGSIVAAALQTLLYGAPAGLVNGCWFGLLAVYGVWLLLLKKGTGTDHHKMVMAVLVGSFLLQLYFVLRMPYHFSWHDLGAFGNLADKEVNSGHLGIINYLVKFGHLPLVNPLEKVYEDYYQPILYHVAQALFLKGNLLLGIPLEAALENLQVVTLALSSLCVYVGYRILAALGFSEKGQRMGLFFLAFQPILIIFAGTLNNDIASTLCMLLTIFCTLRWLQKENLRWILAIALSMGAGMAVKLSVGVLALPVGMVFAVRFFRNLKAWKKYLLQFALFLLVCAPLGLGWPIYHFMEWQMPLSYVRLPAQTINVGDRPLSMRIGMPSVEALKSLFFTGIRKVDYNLWFQLLKTALFDELTLYPQGSGMWYVSYLLTAVFSLTVGISLFFLTRALLRRNGVLAPLTQGLLALFGAALLGSHIYFCLYYPYISAFNFRYIMALLLLCAIGLADAYQEKRKWQWVLSGFLGLFVGLVFLVYGVFLFMQ